MTDPVFDLLDEEGTLQQLEPSAENKKKRKENIEKFSKILEEYDEDKIDRIRGSANETLVQKLCGETLSSFIEILFKFGSPDVKQRRANAVGYENDSDYPLLIAATKGDVDTLRVLINNGADIAKAISKQNETVLHSLLEKSSDDYEMVEKYKGCLSLFLGITKPEGEMEETRYNQICQIVNKRDRYQNTALYYASHKWPASITLALLKHGAKLSTNKDNDSVIRSISPETLEEFLDSHCLTSSNFGKTFEDGAAGRDIHIGHEELEITFDYSFLTPSPEVCGPRRNNSSEHNNKYLCCCAGPGKITGEEYFQCKGKDNDVEAVPMGTNSVEELPQNFIEQDIEDNAEMPEAEPLWHLSQSNDHCRLLKHPVITSFLSLKWMRIRQYYNRNLRLYAFFVFILTRFILYGMDNSEGKESASSIEFKCTKNSPWFYAFNTIFILMVGMFTFHDIWLDKVEESSRKDGKILLTRTTLKLSLLGIMIAICIAGTYEETVIKWTLLTLAALLIFRELFQFIVSIPRYISSYENWMEVALMIMVFLLLFNNDPQVKRQASAFAIILSWIELILLIGKHPSSSRMNIYVTMLLKVTTSFLSFLLVYILFILAFALGFYVSLEKLVPTETPKNCTSQPNNGDYDPFSTGLQSFIKTSAMFSGELEFGDLMKMVPTHPSFLDYLFFLSFLFFVVIILMNLLTGLAVNDVAIIKEKAEIIAYRSQVDLICTAEAILLDDPYNFLSYGTKCEWINKIPTSDCWKKIRSCWRKIRSCIYHLMLPFITCSLSPKAAAKRILLFNQKRDKDKKDIFTIKPNERICLGHLTGTRLFDYQNVVVPAKKIIVRTSEKKQSVDLEKVWDKITKYEDQLKISITSINSKIDEMSREINEKLDKLLN